jgi:heme exporter protein A
MDVFSGDGLDCMRGGRRVFAGLNFRIESGGVLVLVGPNGSGKSSLLRMMAGLTPPATGWIGWNGAKISEDAEAHHRRLHYVGHLHGIKPALTCVENLSLWPALRHGSRTDRDVVVAALDEFGLRRLADMPALFLSQGQRRRLTLARLTAAPACLWLLDEPRSALDIGASLRLDALIARHRDAGGIVVIAQHDDALPAGAVCLDLAGVARASPC